MSCTTHYYKENNIIVFDKDSNLIYAETIDELARTAGVVSKVEEITKRATCGDLNFGQAPAEKGNLREGFPLETVLDALNQVNLILKDFKSSIHVLESLTYSIVIRHSMSTSNSRITKMPAFLLDREAP